MARKLEGKGYYHLMKQLRPGEKLYMVHKNGKKSHITSAVSYVTKTSMVRASDEPSSNFSFQAIE